MDAEFTQYFLNQLWIYWSCSCGKAFSLVDMQVLNRSTKDVYDSDFFIKFTWKKTGGGGSPTVLKQQKGEKGIYLVE